MRRNFGEVEHDGRPELDVGRKHPVRTALGELSQRRLFERLGHLIPRGVELTSDSAQRPGPWVLGAVHPVPEAHQSLMTVQHAPDIPVGIAGALDLLDHRQDATGPRRAAARSWHRQLPTAPPPRPRRSTPRPGQ